MTSLDPAAALKELDTTLSSIETVLDLPALQVEIERLEAAASVPNLWDDPAAAQQVTSRLSFLQGELSRVRGLRGRLDD